jgi:hypothetical protein
MTFLRRGQITVEGPFSDTGDTVVAVTGITMTDDPSWEGESRRIGAELLRDHLGRELRPT